MEKGMKMAVQSWKAMGGGTRSGLQEEGKRSERNMQRQLWENGHENKSRETNFARASVLEVDAVFFTWVNTIRYQRGTGY